MAAKSSLAAKRRLSLNILAATNANQNRIIVSTADNNRDINLTSNNLNFSSSPPIQKQRKSRLHEKKNKENDSSKDKNIGLNSQTSEIYKTCLHKMVSWRYLMVLLLQSSFVVAMFLRNSLPMAMVCMTRPPSSSHRLDVLFNETDAKTDEVALRRQELVSTNVSLNSNNEHEKDMEYEFDWSSEVQGLILTSIMFTTFIGPLLVNAIREPLGNKFTMTLTNLISTILTFLTPQAARISPYCLVTVRVLLGITLGGHVSVVGDCVAWWAPNDEKLTMIALSFTGFNIGGVLSAVLAGYLCLVPVDNGWPFVFYTFGTCSLIWGICWHFLSSHTPEEHPYISAKEKQYIISHRVGMDAPSGGNKVKPPYRKILTSVPVLAYFVTGTFHIWSTYVLFTYLPVFYNKILNFSIQETGLLVSLTSLFRMVGSLFWTAIGNKTVPILGIRKSRKICICIGFLLAGIATVFVGFFDETYKWIVLALLQFVMINQAVGTSTIVALPLDMAPRYAGLLTGMFVSFGSFIAISGPVLISAITSNGTHEEWRIVWIIMGSIFLAGAVLFLLFGQASLQPWSKGKEAAAPHIVSPFVTMGRRFSTFLEAPPLQLRPVMPKANGFDDSQNLQTQTTNILIHLTSTTPEIFYSGHFQVRQPSIPQVIVESPEEVDESYSSDEDVDVKDETKSPQNEDHQTIPVRNRAFSEFGLEVTRRNISDEITVEDLDREHPPLFKQLNDTRDNQINFENELSDQNLTLGNVNKAFEDTEGKIVVHSEHVQNTAYMSQLDKEPEAYREEEH